MYASHILFTSICVAYVVLIRRLRFRRAAHHARLVADSSNLDNEEMPLPVAQEIYDSLMHAEFPFWIWKGIEMGLFRTYAIPTISAQLAKTSRLLPPKLPRRYVETQVLFLEFTLRKWGTVPWLQAMARTRAIHAGYRESGAVREEDMLYTLAALATTPVLLVEKLEWRSLSDVELAAIGTLYRAIADALEIDYSLYLASWTPGEQRTSIVGLDFYHALHRWQVRHEIRHMVYMPQNELLCEAAVDMLLWAIPGKPLKRFVTTALTSVMDDLLREAVGFPPTPFWIAHTTYAVLDIRKFCLRYLCPPRPDFLKIQWCDSDPSSIQCAFAVDKSFCRHGRPDKEFAGSCRTDPPRTGMTTYVAAPFFVKPTFRNRWLSPKAWWWWALRLPIPGDKPVVHKAGGYTIPDLGPRGLGCMDAAQEKEEAKVETVGLAKGWW
ncbi:uncharacterized protein TRUGW13939_08801 [Talaromyces rugulosus]|uniref:ER-bound oxygenase mpaB/mpaB'/Rubber oxygenase catalytic domain-containing protein n=1 Tax=Talaromyces rugulosus TaxID=121627 RepID=A0A7H8R5J3_TALRU|nr:uncharacterized protein TRUGW13939_08801 [Talaromyces rugulosus]QKX61649.1 hypothetical protein TRUGW13939_08801 [Talaromyces rugulosus]